MDLVLGKVRFDSYIRIAFLILVASVLSAFAPDEVTLGPVIKLVFAHLAVAWSGLALFAAAGIVGAAYLIFRKPALGEWAVGTQRAALIFWIIYIASSILVAWLAWGGVNWTEPRLIIAFRNATIASVAVAAGFLIKNVEGISGIGVVLSVAVFELWSTRSDQLHPGNPIGSSDSIELKVFSYGILAVAFLCAVLTSHILRPGKAKEEQAPVA
ncbi:MAG: hypothetical protein ACYC1U_09850 [Candidatus Aquicultorales bacterium]